MKKFTFIAAAALTAMAANAQGYSCEPGTEIVADMKPSTVEYICLPEASVEDLQLTGATVTYIGTDDGRCQLDIWNAGETLSADFSAPYPNVDGVDGGYWNFTVRDAGWSGGGFQMTTPYDLSMFNEDTHFHLAYMSVTDNGPASVGLIIGGSFADGVNPAKVALGEDFNDNGEIYPSIAPAVGDDWQGIDISFAALKSYSPGFNLLSVDGATKNYLGYILSFVGGGVEGTTFSFDCVYFYNLGDAGVEGIAADNKSFIVTNNTINLNGGNGIELYDMAGKVVKKTAGCVLGINNLAKGVYVAKSGKLVKKVVVR